MLDPRPSLPGSEGRDTGVDRGECYCVGSNQCGLCVHQIPGMPWAHRKGLLNERMACDQCYDKGMPRALHCEKRGRDSESRELGRAPEG